MYNLNDKKKYRYIDLLGYTFKLVILHFFIISFNDTPRFFEIKIIN